MENTNTKKKVADYLYKYAVNTSSRKKSYPSDYTEISDNRMVVGTIGLDVNTSYNQCTVRVQFVGSEKFFVLGIGIEKFDYWYGMVKLFTVSRPDIELL